MAKIDHLHYARVCVEVKQDAVLPSKIFLSKCSATEVELVVNVEVEFLGKQARRGHISTLCHSQPASSLMGRNLGSRETPVPPSMDKQIGVQQNGPGFAHDLGQPDAATRYEVLDDLVPGLDQPDLGLRPMMAPCPDDRPPADAESIGFLEMVSSPSPLEAPTDQHGKAPWVLSRGLGDAAEGISKAGANPISIRPCTDAARLEALEPRAATIMVEPFFPACEVVALDAIPSSVPTDSKLGDEPAVSAYHSPQDGQFIHHDSAPALVVDLDLTPNSISHLSSKYSWILHVCGPGMIVAQVKLLE
ncbi:hypothetical protein Nepgr_033525 [Nepenthes gracilis]|uniref:Uncharacterized protein n=1 Tax=Nepenthes gracilis TaxID=150966 RepID=A0AAD3Y909_NEPGR|nr:hypothetical protein Nepgr_033525 [Nepenthes gracilis]